MNKLKCVIIKHYKTSLKMKRIALIFLSVMSLMACTENKVDPGPDNRDNPEGNNLLSLSIHIPPNSLSTYSTEDANSNENYIDELHVILFEGTTPIDEQTFLRTDPKLTFYGDSVLVAYEVNNITSPSTLNVQVFANRKTPDKLANNTEVPRPEGNAATSFFMSGKVDLTNMVTSFRGVVQLKRNVAKLRVNVSLNSVYIPEDLKIDYRNIKIQVIDTPDSTTLFDSDATQTFPTIQYPEHTGYTGPNPNWTNQLRPAHDSIITGSLGGGQIDSVYLYENRSITPTKVLVTIPTLSSSEGNKTAPYTYSIQTTATGSNVMRN